MVAYLTGRGRHLANEQEDFAQQYSYPSRRLWDTFAIPE